MRPKQLFPAFLLILIVGPATLHLASREDPPPPVPMAAAPEPRVEGAPATPRAWFERVRARCTAADVRLSTDLTPAPPGMEGTAYEAACFALAGNIPNARALLLGLEGADRVAGATLFHGVARELVDQGRHDVAGPLMELVLEFLPDHQLALYDAGTARWVTGDHAGARTFLERFLEVYQGRDERVNEARRMISGYAER